MRRAASFCTRCIDAVVDAGRLTRSAAERTTLLDVSRQTGLPVCADGRVFVGGADSFTNVHSHCQFTVQINSERHHSNEQLLTQWLLDEAVEVF